MSSAWSQLEQMLTCAICLDKFKNPRLLPCQHSFCGDACMEGLVDYARRQIKCPECRAEHRIPYQGVQSLPSNVTLIRFLELHSRITGEEPEPVPTFMEKCSVCGEKVDGVQRCSHCDKKVCPECKEAHIDLLRREINRINGQSKRCLSKLQEFKEQLRKADERLAIQHKSVRSEIEESCRRLIDDLKAKQSRLLGEVDSYVENEQSTLDKLKVAIVDELEVLESNSKLADDRVANNKFQWTDQELWEMKEIYAKAMEFVRLFDPDLGDFNRKIRFNLIPEFEQMRRRICELGELKFGETVDSLIVSSFQYCNATGQLALELGQKVANQMAAAASSGANQQAGAGYGLAASNSNTNLAGSTLLELPGSMNSLMRSQSDHRLASQFQLRLKQQQQEASGSNKNGAAYGAGRYGAGSGGAGRDSETDAIRSRYAPPRSSIGSSAAAKDYANELLTRDWPRPSDNDGPDMPSAFGSSGIHFKSAFMRRKEKERQSLAGSNNGAEYDDDDLTSEASYGGLSSSGRNVRFYDQQQSMTGSQVEQAQAAAAQLRKLLFDCKEVEHAPMSGVPRLDECPHLLQRLHQMGAKAIVDKKQAEEDGKRDKDLIDSARQAMTQATERSKLAQRQMSEDEIEKQKRAIRHRDEQQNTIVSSETSAAQQQDSSVLGSGTDTIRRGTGTRSQQLQQHEATSGGRQTPPAGRESPTIGRADTAEVAAEPVVVASSAAAPATPPSPAAGLPGGRRSLYGQAVTEKSRRQLSSAIQDAAAYSSSLRRSTTAASSADGEQTPDTSVASNSSGTSTRPKRTLRSSGRSLSKQSSVDTTDGGTSTAGRRRRLARAESSQTQQSSVDSTATPTTPTREQQQSKNYATGSGGQGDHSQASRQGSLMADGRAASAATDQTSTTTDEDADPVNLAKDEEDNNSRKTRTPASMGYASRSSFRQQTTENNSDSDESDEDDDDDDDDGGDSDANEDAEGGGRNKGNRRSREMLPNAVNKLLDRSAQIRRDSQEQRSRGDSPQRTVGGHSATAAASSSASGSSTGRDCSAPSQSSYYSSSTRPSASTNLAAASGFSSATRQRLAYQRSSSIRDDDTDAKTNSNNSIYTTASSLASGGRRSSIEDESPGGTSRRMSGNSSSDRTLTSRPSYRRDSSGDSPSVASSLTSAAGYQSRFLSRSRTSAALSSSGSSSRSQDKQPTTGDLDSLDRHSARDGDGAASGSGRSYLSSRDRFMQSADTSSLYGSSRASAVTASPSTSASAAGKFTNLLAWRSKIRSRHNHHRDYHHRR